MNDSTKAGARILVVDDSSSNRSLLEAILTKAGHSDLLMAESAEEAFRHLGMDQPASPDPKIDLILLDIMMPDMDGIEACRRIKAVGRLHDIPIIMVTAKTAVEDLQVAFAVGAMDYITKPLKKIELQVRVGSAWKLKQSMDLCRAQGQTLLNKNHELERALQEINVLRGLIPICATCRKVRNETGAWQNLEAYVTEHSGALFSHGICADCLARDYPEFEKG